MNDAEKKAFEIDREGPDKMHRKIREGLETIKAGGKPEPVDIGGHNVFDRLFFSKLPDLELDYFVNPFIHISERENINPKIKALLFITSYLSREPKDTHGITQWSIFAKSLGATDDEILECAAVANITNGKVQALATERSMEAVFKNPDFINAKDETR